MTTSGTTEQGEAAMQEFGFDPVELDQVGAPTPGRIAESLFDICSLFEAALDASDLQAVEAVACKVGRLCNALDAWDTCICWQHHVRQETEGESS